MAILHGEHLLTKLDGNENKIKEIMENAVDLALPNKVDCESGPNWGSIK